MQIRRRLKRAGQDRVPLSDSELALVTPPTRKRRTQVRGSKRPVMITPDRRTPAGDVLNAYWQKSDLVLVVPADDTPNGVRYKRLTAEHSCFVKCSDLEEPVGFVRMLNAHASVRKAVWETPEGESSTDRDWLRIVWTSRDALRHYCRILESNKTEGGKDKAPIQTYEGLVSPILRHMVDNDLKPATPRQVWFDIETDSRQTIRSAMAGEARVLCWATEDADGNCRHGMLEHDTDEDEARLLSELWDVFENYDQIMAWNLDRFDGPVIKARSDKHNLLQGKDRDWRRWLWLDHLDLYRRMNMAAAETGDEKQSYALQAVATAILGDGKDDFDAAQTYEAWAAGGEERARLLEYNIKDTALMPRIEVKTGFIELLRTVAETCGTFADSRGSKPGLQVDSFLMRIARDRGHKFPTVLKRGGGDPYEGAYVQHPKPGLYRDVHVGDFKAQYPTIIRTWNISPETLIVNPPSDVPTAYCPLTNCHFRTDIPGILPEAVKQMMELRDHYDQLQASLTPGTEAWEDAGRSSKAYKICVNSFYGVIGDPSSVHYSVPVAESITQNAKWEILETIKAAEERGMDVIYADTDSLFVVGSTREEFEEFVQWCNDELYPRITREQGCKENHIKLAYEKQFERIIFTTAKRYVGNYIHYKGKLADDTSKPEIKGLEIKRGDSLRITRHLQQEVAHRLVGYQSEHDPEDIDGFDEVIDSWLGRVLEDPFELDDILVSKRLNKGLDDYKVANPMVRIAREMAERGEDVGEGVKISYVILDAAASPQVVQAVHEWDPDSDDMDRMALWDKQIWPPTQRLLEAAFPDHSWNRFTGLIKARRAAVRAEVRKAKTAEKEDARLAKLAAKGAPTRRRRKKVTI